MLANLDDGFENFGTLKLFKSYRNYLVAVFLVDKARDFKTTVQPSHLRVIVKKFDKYKGFTTEFDKRLFFKECTFPFYDLLFSYKKDLGEKLVEKETGKYKYHQHYRKNQESKRLLQRRSAGV